MKVFFSASGSASGQYGDIYKRVVELLKREGMQVYDDSSAFMEVNVLKLTDKNKKNIYRKMITEMDKADFSVFEATWPSTLHVGHKITLSYWKNKPVIALFMGAPLGHEPILFRGIERKKVLWIDYNKKNLETKLLDAIEKIKKMMDIRFNFFISRELVTYLDWISKEMKVNRSEYIRGLIEKEIEEKRK